MAYDPTLPGLGEATRAWINSQIVSNLSSLNTALARDGATPITALTSACVHLGDPDKLPDVSTCPIFFSVVGGGRMDGMDIDGIQQYYLSPVGYTHTIYSSITAYIHPDSLPNTDGVGQAAARQLVLDRVADWLRAACFNTSAAVAPVIGSREFCATPAYDQLNMAHIHSIEKGITGKSFAASQLLPYVHCRHQAQIVGNG